MSSLPGDGHVYGNFPSYYSFHSCESRISILPSNLFEVLSSPSSKVYTLLDVGCNSGDLTLQLYKKARQELPSDVCVKVLGIDIDDVLIARANSKVIRGNSKAIGIEEKDGTSATGPSDLIESEGDERVEVADGDEVLFAVKDIMNLEDQKYLQEYFNENQVHLISLFSVTLWIHLNHGDNGIKTLFAFSASLLHNSQGVLLIEPQPWKAYVNAKKRASRLALPVPLHYHSIKLKNITSSYPSDFDQIVIDDEKLGFRGIVRCGVGKFNTQQRPVILYLKQTQVDLSVITIDSMDSQKALGEREKKKRKIVNANHLADADADADTVDRAVDPQLMGGKS